jgi:sugar phosphate isomerase/epimerase
VFRLGVITDEVSQDLKAAIDFALEFGLRGLEIRTASGKNIMDMTTDEVKEIRKMADGSGLEVPSISSPVFKCIVYSSTFSNISETVRTKGRHNVKALYDPGNAVYCDSSEPPYPEGYELIRDILCHIHIKDAKRVKGEVVSTDLGEGAVDYRGIFQRLFDDGYEGYIILETHHRYTEEIPESLLNQPGGYSFSAGGLEASRVSAQNMIKLIGGAKK